MEETLSRKNIRKLFLSLLPVQAFAVGMPAINNLLDSFIIGNFIGANGLAAVGFCGPLLMLVSAFSSMIATGSQLLCGQALGKGDRKEMCRIYSTALVLCLVIGLAFSVSCWFFADSIAVLLGAQDTLLTMTAGYVRGMGVGLVFSLLNGCMLPFLQLDHSKKTATLVVAVMLISNVCGDAASVFIFHGGMLGVGLATTISFLLAVLISGARLLRSRLFRFSIADFSAGTVANIFRLGFPNGLEFLCLVVRNRVINHFVYLYAGSIGMSAMTVANNITTAFGCVLEAGYSGSGRMIASILTGQRDSSTLRDLPKIMAGSVWWMYLALYGIVLCFTGPLALFFGADPAELATYILVIRLFNLWYLTNIFKAPPICLYQGTGQVQLMSILTVLNNLVIPVAICFGLSGLMGISAVASCSWMCEIGLMLCMAVIFLVKAKRLPRSPLELAYVPSTISAPRENRFKATICTAEDAVKASEDIIAFCKTRGIPERNAMYCGLCVEEMSTDTIAHGFVSKDNTIDVRMIIEDGHARILLRDNCREFDPVAWLSLCDKEEKDRSIGIRMVSQLSSEMNYVCTLGMNILTIVV